MFEIILYIDWLESAYEHSLVDKIHWRLGHSSHILLTDFTTTS